MRKQHQKIINEISKQVVEKYQQSDNVIGIFLIGSAAQGSFDQYSDVDFYILLNEPAKHERIHSVTDNVVVEILFDTLAQAQQYLGAEKNKIYRNTSHMIANGKILYATSSWAKKIQLQAKNNLKLKTKFTKHEIVMHKYSLEDFLEDARRDAVKGDVIGLNLNSQYFVQNAIELILKIKGGYLRKPKEMSGAIKNLDVNFQKLLTEFYSARSLSEKMKILEKISDHVTRKYNGKLPGFWKI